MKTDWAFPALFPLRFFISCTQCRMTLYAKSPASPTYQSNWYSLRLHHHPEISLIFFYHIKEVRYVDKPCTDSFWCTRTPYDRCQNPDRTSTSSFPNALITSWTPDPRPSIFYSRAFRVRRAFFRSGHSINIALARGGLGKVDPTRSYLQ